MTPPLEFYTVYEMMTIRKNGSILLLTGSQAE